MTTHELKTDPAVFQAVATGAKTHEIRLNDRAFAVGDILQLRETVYSGAEMRAGAELLYTGRTALREVSHIQTGYGLLEGWCILSFAEGVAELEYATRLARFLWSTHYSATAPDWKPLDDLYGVLSQLDNMLAGLTSPRTEPLASITTDKRFMELVDALAKADTADLYKAAFQLLAKHVDGQLGRQHQAIRTLMRLNERLAEMAASTPPRLIGIDWSTDYLTEQRAAMRDAAAELVEQAQDGTMRMATAAAIRQLDPRPVLTQGSIDRAKHALEDFAGAVWNQPNSASQVSPAMALPHRTHAQHLEHAASSALTPEYKAAQAGKNAAATAQLAALEHKPGQDSGGLGNMRWIQPTCSCGWKGTQRFAYDDYQHTAVRDDIARHLREVKQEQRQ